MIGKSIAHYDITELLGEGGMGQVFRATDSKLKRIVALKVLPASIAQDPDRMARFRREAELLAALNHPNVAVIHGLENDGETYAIAMELVEGETLAHRISRGAIPADEALAIALQIAEALEAAHDKGIVHRDLKPANVVVTASNKVKVLDFGLAKALTPGSGPGTGDSSNSPTLTARATQAGMILGTAAYMSPEQARGMETDGRADIWAFGAVLFEMLSGRRAFEGEDITLTLAAVVKDQPDWPLLPDEARPLRRVLARCLTKHPRERYHHIADVRIAIEETLAAPKTANEGVVAAAGLAGLSGLHKAVLGVTVLGVALLATFVTRALRPDATPHVIQSSVLLPEDATLARFGGLALSPDGRFLAFGARRANGERALWVRPLDGATSQPLTGTENAVGPFWSRDSRSIGFFADGKLMKIDYVTGGSVEILDTSAGIGRQSGATWNQDGTILFTHSDRTIHRMVPDGGTSLPVTTLGAEDSVHARPSFLPDGNHFLYVSSSIGSNIDGRVYVGSLDGIEPKLVLADALSPLYAAPGYLIFGRAGLIRAQRFDARRLEVEGELHTLASDASFDGEFTASSNGIFAYHAGAETGFSQLRWYDRSGLQVGVLGEPGNYYFPRLSHDGRRLAVDLSDVNDQGDLWIYDLQRPVPSRFTFSEANDSLPIWSRDDSQIIFGSTRRAGTDANDLYLKPTTRQGEAELLLPEDLDVQPTDWSRDERFVLFNRRQSDVWVFSTEDETASPLLEGPYIERDARFSPDGQWIAYVSDESGEQEVYVRPFQGPGVSIPITDGGGSMPTWSADGRELFFITPDRRLMSVAIRFGQDLEIDLPLLLFATDIKGGGEGDHPHQYDVTADGQQFIINTLVDPDDKQSIALVTNWVERLGTAARAGR